VLLNLYSEKKISITFKYMNT